MSTKGAYYDDQVSYGVLDSFTVFRLHLDNPELIVRVVRLHFRKVLLPHLFKRQDRTICTKGPRVST